MSLEMDGKNINSNIVYDDVNQWLTRTIKWYGKIYQFSFENRELV